MSGKTMKGKSLIVINTRGVKTLIRNDDDDDDDDDDEFKI
jgi:hypothetical protein